MLFDVGPDRVEAINPPGTGLEVGDKDMVGVLGVLEQSQLLGLYGIFRDGPASNHKAMLLFPLLVGFDPKLAHLPSVFELGKLADLGFGLDHLVSAFLDDNDIAAFLPIEEFHRLLAVIPGIHAKADTRSGNGLGRLGQADFEEWDEPRGGGRVAWAQGAVPEFLASGLETKLGMVGAPAVLFGVVAHPGSLVLAVDDDDRGIDVEDQAVAHTGQSEQVNSQAVVKPDKLPDSFWRETFEEPPQTGLIGETIEPQHFQEGSVVLQDFCFVDAPESHDDGEHQGKEEFGGMVGRASLAGLNIALQQAAQAKFVAKTLDQPHSAEVSNVGFLECNRDFSGTFWHLTESTLLGSFVSYPFYQIFRNNFSSTNM